MSPPIRIAVLDYGAANMVSITKALAAVGADVVVAMATAALRDADYVIVMVQVYVPAVS